MKWFGCGEWLRKGEGCDEYGCGEWLRKGEGCDEYGFVEGSKIPVMMMIFWTIFIHFSTITRCTGPVTIMRPLRPITT